MTISKREIIACTVLISLMMILGVFISGKITEAQADSNEKYNKALKIDNQELFQYGMKTNVGYAFIYGELAAVDPVTYEEVGGEYLMVTEVREEYTRHTREVTHKRSDGSTYTKTEVYYTWDYAGKENKSSKEVIFSGTAFDSNKFDIPEGDYITTIKKSHDVRYKYYGYPSISTGTLFAYLEDSGIKGEGNQFYRDTSIEKAYAYSISESGELIFWILWVFVIGGVVVGFFYLDNKWLE